MFSFNKIINPITTNRPNVIDLCELINILFFISSSRFSKKQLDQLKGNKKCKRKQTR